MDNELMAVSYRDGRVYFLDQTGLPGRTDFEEMKTVEQCRDAIRGLKVRGAPAIGIGAAFSMVVASRNIPEGDFDSFYRSLKEAKDCLAAARPTAVNLFWALERMDRAVRDSGSRDVGEVRELLLREALAIQAEDIEVCGSIGAHGAALLKSGMGILTHCNAGFLATSRYGTALAPVYVARERGIHVRVFADETRPLLQGARLTAYELMHSGVDVTLITDGMAAAVMARGWVDACIVGCDRVAANGDAANKIGTYGLALAAKAHRIPFYVACPRSTMDAGTATGADIPIEEREPEEVTSFAGVRTAPEGVKVFNPAFDVTPNDLIAGIITEKGILYPPYGESIRRVLA